MATGVGAAPAPAAFLGLWTAGGTAVSAGLFLAAVVGAGGGFDAAVVLMGVARALLVSSSQSMTSSVTGEAAGAVFLVVIDFKAGATGPAVEVEEARFASSSCRRATNSAFLPV